MVGLVTWHAVVLKKKWKCDGHIEARHIFLRKAQFGEPKTLKKTSQCKVQLARGRCTHWLDKWKTVYNNMSHLKMGLSKLELMSSLNKYTICLFL